MSKELTDDDDGVDSTFVPMDYSMAGSSKVGSSCCMDCPIVEQRRIVQLKARSEQTPYRAFLSKMDEIILAPRKVLIVQNFFKSS
jgi:hypothetical protein